MRSPPPPPPPPPRAPLTLKSPASLKTANINRFGETEELKKHINTTEAFDINARDASECTILLWAARNGHDDTVRYLCSISADLNMTGFGGWSALQHAVGSSRENMVALLLEHDANPNISDETGTTALHIAAARGAINIVVRLIDAHADVNAQNNTGVRPLHHGASQRIRTR